ncbi:hypothetical protein MKZ38_007950 [Zalerion maritima]|uniref:Uncharacterized protein n=1 Tax=Zalerion maritima TaxID=339359 RepID=A0AAD5WMQ6_9PEZI|nr:hypothetical protein MKZ38_007950 [Zalerion maritima]
MASYVVWPTVRAFRPPQHGRWVCEEGGRAGSTWTRQRRPSGGLAAPKPTSATELQWAAGAMPAPSPPSSRYAGASWGLAAVPPRALALIQGAEIPPQGLPPPASRTLRLGSGGFIVEAYNSPAPHVGPLGLQPVRGSREGLVGSPTSPPDGFCGSLAAGHTFHQSTGSHRPGASLATAGRALRSGLLLRHLGAAAGVPADVRNPRRRRLGEP